MQDVQRGAFDRALTNARAARNSQSELAVMANPSRHALMYVRQHARNLGRNAKLVLQVIARCLVSTSKALCGSANNRHGSEAHFCGGFVQEAKPQPEFRAS